ncbi:hypothetical protein [Burkholderia anthina]|uniref:hypothetical protein n=1 Tax=Burkholderia anthina TaxID=179879 RepID=UPI00158C5559|nr:hypothetical protein [Burkholderia anthina]
MIVVTGLLLSACTGNTSALPDRAKTARSTAGVITGQDSANSSQETADSDRTAMIDGFLKRLANVADSGAMLDVDATMHRLGIGYRSETGSGIPLPPDCHIDWHPKQLERTTVTVDEQSWYKPTRYAKARGASQTNAAYPPSIKYVTNHEIRCTDRYLLQDSTEAVLEFEVLPQYACITESDIYHALPAARRTGAGLGIPVMSLYVGYRGRSNDDFGTMLTFTFYSDSPCAASAKIRQAQDEGMRFQRALWNHALCVAEEQHDYCVAHGGAAISQAELNGIDDYVKAHCPTINAMYLKEPRSGQAAPTGNFPRRTFSNNPCGF